MNIDLDPKEIQILLSWYEILDRNHFEMYIKDQELKEKLEKLI